MKRVFIIATAILALVSCDLFEITTVKIIEIDENMTYEEMYNTIATPLKEGDTRLTITLPGEPSDETFKAIRRALIETQEVADGSIDMTLYGAKVIGEEAFGYHADLNNEWINELKSVTLPDAVEIKGYAFYGCKGLVAFSAPEANTLGVNVFVACNELTYIYLPKAEYIGNGTFGSADNITDICLPELRELSRSMFNNCQNLETVVLPKVTRIHERVFEECMQLKTIVFGSPIESIGREVFRIHDEQYPDYTERIDLVLSSQQRLMINASDDDSSPHDEVWSASSDRCDFNDNEFAGYRFRSIRPFEEYESDSSTLTVPSNCILM